MIAMEGPQAVSWGMLLAGVVVLGWVMLRLALRRSSAGGKARTEKFRRSAEGSGPMPVEATRWMVELHEHSREVRGEIDSKLAVLQALLKTAAEERGKLEAAIARAEQLGLSGRRESLELIEEEMPLEPLEADAPPRARLREDRPKIYALADHGASAGEIAQRLGLAVGDVEIVLSLRPAV